MRNAGRFLALAIAVVGVGVAALAPVSLFDEVLARLIGSGGSAGTTAAQRVVAACGALLGALAIAAWGTASAATLPAPGRWRLVAAGGPFVALVAANVAFAGAAYGAWARPVAPRAAWTVLALALVAGFALVLSSRTPAAARRPPRALLFATAAGAGYGGFSALWHCCSPLWQVSSPVGALGEGAWLLALSLAPGAIGRVAAAAAVPRGELLGAVLFACAYPWHTPIWFAQCLVAGAFSTWMVRVTGSGWAPAIFLGTAYVTHMTLPFMGWAGAGTAVVILGAHALAAAPVRADSAA